MIKPTDQSIDEVLARLDEWRRCFEELVELQAQLVELHAACSAGQTSQDLGRCLHVMKFRITELKEKLTTL